MPTRCMALLLVCLIIFPPAGDVQACSVSAGYLKPSNYELVRDAKAIVLAKAIRVREGPDGREVDFEVVAIFKGDVTEKTLTDSGHDNYQGASDPADFSRARPGAYRGSCTAMDYKIGVHFLLLLNRGRDQWVVSGPPFTRINEEVDGGDAPWAKAVKAYVGIAALGDGAKQKAALKELLAGAKKADKSDKYQAALAADIERHLASPHGSKSFEDLMELYKQAATDQERRPVMWALARGGHEAAKPFIREMLKSGEWKKHVKPVAEYVAAVKDKESLPLLAGAFPTAKAEDRWAIMWSLIQTADETQGQAMHDVLKAANAEEASRLTKWFSQHPSNEAIEICSKLLGEEYEKKSQLTYGLAGMGDAKTVEWALRFAKEQSESRWIAFYVLARSPLAEADDAARKVIASDDITAVTALVQGYEESFAVHRVARLDEALARHKSNAEVRIWIMRSLQSLADAGDTKAKEVIKAQK